MTTKKPVVASRYAVIRIGYDSYVLPVKNAAAVVEALAEAELIEHEGYGDERMYFIGGGQSIDLHLELLPEHQYLQGKFAGTKATYDHDKHNDINV
jgi:hypothetical protein